MLPGGALGVPSTPRWLDAVARGCWIRDVTPRVHAGEVGWTDAALEVPVGRTSTLDDLTTCAGLALAPPFLDGRLSHPHQHDDAVAIAGRSA